MLTSKLRYSLGDLRLFAAKMLNPADSYIYVCVQSGPDLSCIHVWRPPLKIDNSMIERPQTIIGRLITSIERNSPRQWFTIEPPFRQTTTWKHIHSISGFWLHFSAGCGQTSSISISTTLGKWLSVDCPCVCQSVPDNLYNRKWVVACVQPAWAPRALSRINLLCIVKILTSKNLHAILPGWHLTYVLSPYPLNPNVTWHVLFFCKGSGDTREKNGLLLYLSDHSGGGCDLWHNAPIRWRGEPPCDPWPNILARLLREK